MFSGRKCEIWGMNFLHHMYCIILGTCYCFSLKIINLRFIISASMNKSIWQREQKTDIVLAIRLPVEEVVVLGDVGDDAQRVGHLVGHQVLRVQQRREAQLPLRGLKGLREKDKQWMKDAEKRKLYNKHFFKLVMVQTCVNCCPCVKFGPFSDVFISEKMIILWNCWKNNDHYSELLPLKKKIKINRICSLPFCESFKNVCLFCED